jgi:hypothetical protein
LYINNFINIILVRQFIWYFLTIAAVLAGLHGFFNVTDYTAPFFNAIFNTYWALQLWHLLVCILLLSSISKNLYLDAGLSSKHDVAKTEDLTWLNQFGTIGTFLKNDIKLIKQKQTF